ncbi:protein kinase [Nocardia sp. NPDC005978]|uniref:serine/threonine-protein kinase n=1 Tax=Nocardia sp. NPDC005978 TaxID=3156725 RepID=UPI0033AFDE1C
MPLLRGDVVAGYTVERRLGVGGMGSVYLARDAAGRPVALKVLDDVFATRVRAASTAGGERPWAKFARAARGLEHPNIVRVTATGTPADEPLWIATEFVDGIDAGQLLRHGVVDPSRAVGVIEAAARAVGYARSAGVRHGDIRPSNLLVGRDDRVLVTGFGLADAFGDAGRADPATFAYAAPERFSGGALDERSEVYALGCVLYELLTGSTPFPHADPAAVMAAHLGTVPAAPSTLRGVPAALDAVVATALAKDPDGRFASCQAFALAAAAALTTTAPTGQSLAPVVADSSVATRDFATAVPLLTETPGIDAPATQTAPANPEVPEVAHRPRTPSRPVPAPPKRSRTTRILTAAGSAVMLVGTLVLIAMEMDPGRDQAVAEPVGTSAAPATSSAAPTAIAPTATPPVSAANAVKAVAPAPESSPPLTSTTPPSVTDVPVTIEPSVTAEPLPAVTPTSELAAPVTTDVPIAQDIDSMARAQCPGYVTLVREHGTDGALAVLQSQPSWTLDPGQGRAVLQEALRLSDAGQCG